MKQEKQSRNTRNVFDKQQTDGELSNNTSICSEQQIQEQCDFQKFIKEKQGKLFKDEPAYLKGQGFNGDGDEINYENKTLDASHINLTLQNKSLIRHRNSQTSLVSERLNTPTKEFDINKFKDYKNEFEQESSLSQIRNNGQTNAKQIDKQSYHMKLNYSQPSSQKNLNQNQYKQQDIPIQIENIDGTDIKNQDNSVSIIEYHKIQPNVRYNQNQINQIDSYGNQRKTKQNNSKDNKNCKQLNSYPNAQSGKNANNKSRNIKNRLNENIFTFINKLKILSFTHSNKNLSEQEYTLINDQCYFSYCNQNQLIQHNSFIQICQQIISYIPQMQIILPSSLYLMIWNIFIIIFTFLFIYIYSIFIFFDQYQNEETYLAQIFQKIAFAIFLIDLFINLNIAYYQDDNVIKDRLLILKRYFNSYLIMDLASISVLLYQIQFTNNSLQYNPNHSILLYIKNILIFTKIFCNQEKKRRVKDILKINSFYKPIYKFLSLSIFLVITAHSAFCIHKVGILWHIVALIESHHGIKNTWLFNQNIQDSPYYIRYIYSVYWSALTMFQIGYGDIVPANEYESLFCAICAIFLFCIFAYSFHQFGIILQESKQNSKNLREEINKIQRYIKTLIFTIINQHLNIYRFLHLKNVNTELQCRVISYLQFMQNDQKYKYPAGDETMLNKLSVKLRDEVTSSINKIIFNKYKLLFSQFSQQTLNQMTYIMKEVLVSPNEIIFNGDELDDQSIYFIEDGLIEIYHSSTQQFKSHHQIKLLTKNEYFGEISFFSGGFRRASARSLKLSTIHKIERNEFIQIINKNQYDLEKFKMIQDQILTYNDLSCIQIKCFACQSLNHLALSCPNIHKKFDSQLIALKSAYSHDQQRNKKDRKQKASHNSRQQYYV